MHSPPKTRFGYHSNLLSNTFSANQLAPLWALALACILIKHLVCWTWRSWWTLTPTPVVVEPLWSWAAGWLTASTAARRWVRNGSYHLFSGSIWWGCSCCWCGFFQLSINAGDPVAETACVVAVWTRICVDALRTVADIPAVFASAREVVHVEANTEPNLDPPAIYQPEH